MDSILKVTNLNLEIPNRTLFKNLKFEIPAHKLTCVTGENGVGKTTLIKHLLQDLDNHFTQHVQFSIQRDQIQYVPQLRNIDDEFPLSIHDFVSLGFKKRILPWNSPQMKTTLTQILTETNLSNIEKQPLGRSSGGEKQRAYLAQALCANPELLILDEATASLDVISKHELLKLLKKIMATRGLTIIFITHDPDLIEQYADYELHLSNQSGTLLKKEGLD
ncbi:ATP-binding cassette domain-containing protein [Ligilactobacillus sp. WILCCON 0076]|uniref:ATP-binding cassette domain-containing protein n=1 Tax=Ligilactobacillus ubinensis TaxID=2876789 RepID=A0A9X2JNR0_9LACO|nr:ATP-binding cassette domain-containing protein [Ligilactobacillus ubinensis]MCP0887566.1 ATP-binding cassette domain-containing protein [Ligilactobacillus ubinensis]